MQIVSRAYKNEQREYLREYSYIWVYLGVVSREAQRNAEAHGDFADYSQPNEIYSDTEFESYYATCEENYARPGMTFLPHDSEQYALFQGAVTNDFLTPIEFTFGKYQHLDIKGLTIDFGDYYPTSFSVTNGNTTHYYNNTAPGQWVTEDEFLNTGYIRITPYEMSGGQQRLRIHSIMFGVGFVFDNKSLISTQWKATVAHLSDKLPSQTFTFTIDNTNKKFAADDPHSWVAFLQEQQEVSFDFGRDVGNGVIERIPGGILALKSWSSNDQQAKFNAVGRADYVTTKYIKGQYFPEGVTLYELAERVLEDAEIEDYVIDSYLKKVITHNPLPIETHMNLLQLIANTARSVLYNDRKGRIVIKSSFIPEVTSVTSNGEREYSKVENIIKHDFATAEYATGEKNFSGADGHQYFKPRSNNYIEHGFVSRDAANEDGLFEGVSENFLRFVDSEGNAITGLRFVMADSEIIAGRFIGEGIEVDLNESTFSNPIVTIEFEATWTFFNLYLRFADVIPTGLKIHTYKDGEENAVFDVEEFDFITTVEHDFIEIDKIVLEFTSAEPFNRIHLSKVRFGAITDYTLTYRELKESPTATRTNFTKDIYVHYYNYDYGTEEKTISTVKDVSTEESNVTTFNKACHGYSLVYKDISDDEETYKKKTKEIVNDLSEIEGSSSSTTYFVRTETGYDMYEQKVEDEEVSFEFIASVTEEITRMLPSELEENVLYALYTPTDNIYHLYMKQKNNNDEWETYSYGYDVRGTLEIINSGAYYVEFTSTTESDVEIKGYEFTIADSMVSTRIKEMGDDHESKNGIIDNVVVANKQAEWLRDYYANDLEYNLTYRGEPAIDPDDQIFLENRYVIENLIRVTETQISTSTGMGLNCKLKGRRISYKEASRVNYAIVNESEVARG